MLVGLILLPVAMYLRRAMPATLHAEPIQAHNQGSAGLSRQKGIITLAVRIVLGGTVSTYVGNFMTTYAITTLKLSPTIAMGATVAIGLTTFVFSLLGGWVADRHGRRPGT